MNFISYDSKFGQFFVKFFNSCYLNLLWLVCSLPVFTIGASTTALYYATLRFARGEDATAARMFFRSFRQNFKQATVLWLILLGVGLLLATDGYVLVHLRAASTGAPAMFWTLLLAVLIVAAIAYTIILFYIFPLIASVSNTNLAMVKFSFLIGIRYLFCTILIFAVHFAMFFMVVRVFAPLIIFGEGMCAMIVSHFLYKVIDACSYDPNAPVQEETDGREDPDVSDGGGE